MHARDDGAADPSGRRAPSRSSAAPVADRPRDLAAFLVPTLAAGGAERTAGAIAAALDRSGRCAAEVWAIRAQGPMLEEVAAQVPVRPLFDGGRPGAARRALLWAAGDFGAIVVARALRRRLEDRRPSVLVTTLWEADLVASHARRSMRRPPAWIARAVTEPVEMFAKILPARMRRRLPARVLRRATLMVAETVAAAERLAADLGLDRERIRVIPSGLDVERARALADAAPRVTVDGRTIVAVGRLERPKGLDVLVRAFAALRPRETGLRLVIVGEGSRRRDLEALASGLGDAVIFAGFDPNPFAYFSRAALAVVPSRYEPFGNVAIEAMAVGAPVVASDVGGLREIADRGAAGVLVAPDDPDALAAALAALLADDPGRLALASAGWRRVEARYTLDRVARQWADAIAEAGSLAG